MTKLTRVQLVILILCLVGLTAFAGCRRKRVVTPPQTYPVSGKIVSVSGQTIPAGYRVIFEHDDPEQAASGSIAADGSFTLETRYMGVQCEGAAEGEYQVVIVPPINLSTQGAPAILAPEKIKITGSTDGVSVRIP